MIGEGVIASDIEIIVMRWLDKRGILYNFQSSLLGGRFELGGSIVDFTFDDRFLGWRVQGDYWHRQIAQNASDNVQRELLESEGWTIVDVWGDDIKNPDRLDMVLEAALKGDEVF